MLNALNGFSFPSGRTVDPTQIPDPTNQWGPRVGLAYDPFDDGKTVIRGYSRPLLRAHAVADLGLPMNNFRLPAGDLSIELPFTVPAGNPNDTVYQQFQLIGIDLNTYAAQHPAGAHDRPDHVDRDGARSNNDPYAGAAGLTIDTEFRNPRATQFGVRRRTRGAERPLGGSGVHLGGHRLSAAQSRSEPRPSVDPSHRPGAAAVLPGRASARRARPDSGPRIDGQLGYRALALTTRLRKSWGLVSANYVLSESMSDDDNERDAGGPQYQNTYDLSAEWGPARLDRRHQFNGYVVFNLPYRFDLSSGFRFLSGRPIDASMGRDANGDGINIFPTATSVSDRPFSAPGVSFQRNAFRNEPFKDVNFRVQWRLELQGNKQLIFSADVFNVFNWDNIELGGSGVQNYCAGTSPDDCGFSGPTNPNFLSLIDQNPNSATVGQFIRTNNPGAPRQLQFGVRFQF